MAFATPDRSNYIPNFRKSEDNDVIDIGWAEGFLSDGRPYRAECWAQDQVTMLTFFMSVEGIESYERADFVRLLESQGLVLFKSPDRTFVAPARVLDGRQAEMWSINVVIGDDEGSFIVADGLDLHRYESL